MRVLHVTSSYPRTDGDPTGLFVADLVVAQAEAGAEVSVLAPHDAGLAVDTTVAGAPVHRFRYGPAGAEILAYRGGLLAAARRPLGLAMVPVYVAAMSISTVLTARRRGAEIIHAHWWFPAGLAAMIGSRLSGVPFVITLHGSDVTLARRPGLRWLARVVTRRAGAVMAVSGALAEEATAVLARPAGSIVVLAMPVPSVAAGPIAPPPSLPPPPLRVVAVGRLAPEKGFDVLVAAAGRLVADGFATEVEIVGSGPERARLAALAEALGVPLALPGALPRAEAQARMAGAHLVAVPSRREGLGLVAVEALALGCPVVASRVGGLVETVVDGVDGLLVAPDDPPALADALRRCPLVAPRATSWERHRPGPVADAHLGCYRRAMEEPVARWRPLGWLGVATALAVVAVLVRIAVVDWPAIRQAWRHADGVALAAAVGFAAVGEVGFGLASAGALRVVTGRPVPLWGVARVFWVAQTAKNIPGGVWTVVARAGLAGEFGMGGRATVGWLATEGMAATAAGMVVGGLALTVAPSRLPAALWLVLALGGALFPFLVIPASPLARLVARVAGTAPRPGQIGRAALAYVLVWVGSALAFAALCRAIVPLHGHDLVLVGGAACVATVAGFLAVPVPSGLGVREAVLVALLHPVMPTAVAVSVVLASRLLVVVVQTVLAGAALPSVRRGRESSVDGGERGVSRL